MLATKHPGFVSKEKNVSIRYRVIGLYILIGGFTIFSALWALITLHASPTLLGTAILAYTLGLRHAVDVDHIAAIDNVTRKLMQEGKRPIAVGFFFSLGHSSVVVIATVCVALVTTKLMHGNLVNWRELGGIICISISALFLFFIAIINLIIFFSIYKVFQQVRRGTQYQEEHIDALINERGFLAKYFRGLFRFITKSWHMFPLGFLFGIGFDTASEVALLGIAASATMRGTSLWTMLIFPALFTAGMTLIDTTDSVLMLGVYGWAFMKPVRKLYYNLTITFVSVVVALFVGGIEALALIANKIKVNDVLWDAIREIYSHFDMLGYFIIFIFVLSWLASMIIYRMMKLDKLEQKSGPPPSQLKFDP